MNKKCKYCDQWKEDSQLVPFGKHLAISDFNGRVEQQWICAPGMGCQESFKHTWLGGLRGALYYDFPYLLVTLPYVLAINLFFVPEVNAAMVRVAWNGSANSAVYFPVIIPIVGFFALRFPSFFSIAITIAFAYLITN
jgi:hypothetical protein